MSRTTGVRKDHCWSIMLGGRGPGSVALFSIIAFDSRRNSCAGAPSEYLSCVSKCKWRYQRSMPAGKCGTCRQAECVPAGCGTDLDVCIKGVRAKYGAGALVALHGVLLKGCHIAGVGVGQPSDHHSHILAPHSLHLQATSREPFQSRAEAPKHGFHSRRQAA